MLRLSIALVAVAVASAAGAAGWRSLRVDASSHAAFVQSLAEFNDKLTPARRYTFDESLRDIWVAGAESAAAEQREYTVADYYEQLDGLDYEEVVTLLDPTGETARRYRATYDPYSAIDRRPSRASERSAAPTTWTPPDFPMNPAGPNWRL
jgi:hypothetical protein